MHRRTFIRTAGGLALVGVADATPGIASLLAPSKKDHKVRVAVFFDEDFPTRDFTPVSRELLQRALSDFDADFLDLNDLQQNLNPQKYDTFLDPYGSAFPQQAFLAISKFLMSGGNWVNLGGIPFSIPVVREISGWRAGIRQTSYHKKLGITQAFTVPARLIRTFESNKAIELEGGLLGEFTAEEVYELYCRFTSTKDFPGEDGSAGQRDAVLDALAFGISEEHRRIAAPFVQVDRHQGSFAGGRWVLANFRGTITAKAIRFLVSRASEGAIQVTARSTFACYQKGEVPSFTIQLRKPKGDVETSVVNAAHLEVLHEQGTPVSKTTVKLQGHGTLAVGSTTVSGNFSPGLYRVNVGIDVPSQADDKTHRLTHTTGFWVMDTELLGAGKPLTLDEDYFQREGKPYPVTGTTYMTSDVHRKFLFEPNPFLWNRDFAEMKSSGVNMVRTGIWTGWKNYMLDVGVPNEAALRAFDAFVLTARKHDIPVIFTLFAFLPESWGGANAYLDPRAVNAQKEFIMMFAHRYRVVNDLLWDFINEPSFCSPQHLWQCRPNYDPYEYSAWRSWLREHSPEGTEEEFEARLRERYRATPGEPLDLPSDNDFSDVNIFDDRRPVKAIDYRLFAQEKFREWVVQMTAAVRSNGNQHQLVTVGQDEGGTGESPANPFFGDAVDFTCIHNWWLNDDLVWDNVMTKVPGKANLVEETGVMFYETMGGNAWRTEEEARDLLERKLAISIGAGGAGFLQWIWNTNPYMQSDNEAAIGFFRTDGTAKPELDPFLKFSGFFAKHRELMRGRRKEDVLIVIPHSEIFSTRNLATEATKRCVRTLAYRLNTPVASVSEYKIDTLTRTPALIIAPSPRIFQQKGWDELMKLVEKGSTLLVTGALDADDHWMPVERGKGLGFSTKTEPVAQEELLEIENEQYQVSFRGNKIERAEKARIEGSGHSSVLSVQRGKGRILWSLLPVELSDSVEAIAALYKHAIEQTGVSPLISIEKKDPSILCLPTAFEDTILFALVSEGDHDGEVELVHKESGKRISVTVPAQRTVILFLGRKDGEVVGRV
ncbi:MAG: hypothetical protein WBD36_10475 [Bacteroidota bacterium]